MSDQKELRKAIKQALAAGVRANTDEDGVIAAMQTVFNAGFAKAIEMAADAAEEWFHSADASDLDALVNAIKASKPPKD